MSKFKLSAAASLLAVLATVGQVSQAATEYEFKNPVYVYVDGKMVSSAEFKKSGSMNYLFEATVSLDKGEHSIMLADQNKTCDGSFAPDVSEAGRLTFGNNFKMATCAKNKSVPLKILLPGNYTFTISMFNPKTPTVKVLRATGGEVTIKREVPKVKCLTYKGGVVNVDVADTWPEGTMLRDAYSGALAKVTKGKVRIVPDARSEGLVLLEPATEESRTQKPFSWDNAIVYFLLTDRFNNGDKSNDNSFGRQKDGKDEIGTFHGGDFKGIIQKLDYLKQLGVNALWITPMVEQSHGYVGGGDENHSFPFYGYHGYWAADFTRLDPNFGTDEDLRNLVKECHKRGIRLVVDTVMNHAGYATLADLQDFGLESVTKNTSSLPDRWADYKPKNMANWQGYSQFINYNSTGWLDWWGNKWIRAGFPHHQSPGTDDQNMAVGGLPDFITESKEFVSLPKFLKNKKDTRAKDLPNATVLDYLVSWHTYWVRNFGIDGLRCDTAKHIQAEGWKNRRDSAGAALEAWKKENPSEKLDDSSLFMVGEVWDHGLTRNALYYDNGFDSLINFDYQKMSLQFAQCFADADSTYTNYAKRINSDPTFNALSYISSHDTKLFWGDFKDFGLQKRAANGLLMLPGQVQIYYGDESGRGIMPDGGYPDQALRSDMNWDDLRKPEYRDLFQHWSKLNHFRLNHPAVAEGSHRQISNAKSPYYAFVREKGNDKVMVVFVGNRP